MTETRLSGLLIKTGSIPTAAISNFAAAITSSLPTGTISQSSQVQLVEISGTTFSSSNYFFPQNIAVTGSFTTTGTTTIQQVLEKSIINSGSLSGTINFDILNQSVLFYTASAVGNWQVNFRGNVTNTLNSVMTVGQSITVVLLATNGTPAYYAVSHSIDGTSVTPKWQGGTTVSAGNVNSIDTYSYAILKTANATFTILASQTQFA